MIPADFTRRGDWLVSERYGIARVQCWHGTTYTAVRWEYPSDVAAELIGVRQSLDEAVKLTLERNNE